MSNGKGDTPRPISVDKETFDKNWDMVFGKKDSLKRTPEEQEEFDEVLNRIKTQEEARTIAREFEDNGSI